MQMHAVFVNNKFGNCYCDDRFIICDERRQPLVDQFYNYALLV